MRLGTHTNLKNTTFDHCRQKFTKNDPKRTESSKNGVWKVLMTPLQSLFTPSESKDVTHLANEYSGCKLHIPFLFKPENL